MAQIFALKYKKVNFIHPQSQKEIVVTDVDPNFTMNGTQHLKLEKAVLKCKVGE